MHTCSCQRIDQIVNWLRFYCTNHEDLLNILKTDLIWKSKYFRTLIVNGEKITVTRYEKRCLADVSDHTFFNSNGNHNLCHGVVTWYFFMGPIGNHKGWKVANYKSFLNRMLIFYCLFN